MAELFHRWPFLFIAWENGDDIFLARWNWWEIYGAAENCQSRARQIPQDNDHGLFIKEHVAFWNPLTQEVHIYPVISKIIPTPHQLRPPNPEASTSALEGWHVVCIGVLPLTHHHHRPDPVWHPQPSQSGKPHPMPPRLQRFQKLVTERRAGRQWRFPEGTSNKIWGVSPWGHSSSDCPWVSNEWSRVKSTSLKPPLTCPPSTVRGDCMRQSLQQMGPPVHWAFSRDFDPFPIPSLRRWPQSPHMIR